MKILGLLFLICSMALAQQEATHSVYFDVDSHTLSSEEAKKLNAFFDNLLNKDLLHVSIYGYTDDQGSKAYNQALSNRRVRSVQDWLVAHEIELSNIEKQIAGKGEIQLDSAQNDSSVQKARAANRRVDIIFSLTAEEMKKHGVKKIQKDSTTEKPKPKKRKQKKSKEPYISDEVEPFKSLLSDSLKVGQYIRLDNILFEKARSTIVPESMPVLERIAEILKKRKDIHFEIHGHVCCINIKYDDALDRNTGTEKLSVNRARKIWVKLVRAGISRDRMSYKGFGPKRPLGGPDRLDRRVELLITKVVPD